MTRPLTLPEALYIVSQNAHGVAHNYWDVYLPAILLVNEAFPVAGYCDDEDDEPPEMAQRAWNKEQDYLREQLKG
jgi:hypothetical protein